MTSSDQDRTRGSSLTCGQVLSLTCGAAAFDLDADGFFALRLGCQARGLQRAAARVRGPVAPADLVVALARAHAHLGLPVAPGPHALQPGAAAARSRAAPPAQLAVRGRAHRAAAARVPQGPGGTALDRERSAPTWVTRTAAPTRRQHREDGQEDRNQDQNRAASLHGGLNWTEV